MRKAFENNLKQQSDRSKRDCFLHIPKTGGSGIEVFLNALSEKVGPQRVPTKFNHPWTVAQIRELFPDIRIHFVIRDPIDRVVSGFLSRMRMGRPQRNHLWNVQEAVSFSYFRDPPELLRALISDDEREKSAALFAFAGISHLKWNYVHYFESAEYIDQIEGSLGIVREMEGTRSFLEEMCALSGAEPAMIDRFYERTHVSAVSPRTHLFTLKSDEVAQTKAALEPEYAIYRRLQAIAQRQSVS